MEIQAVVDIGTSKIVCAIGRFDAQGKKLEILGAKQTASIGLTKGLISDEDALENAILQVVSQAEHEFGEPIKSVVVNISSTSSKTGDADAAVTAGTELGWKTSIGATGFEIAYGSAAVKDGATTDELEIEMTLSF